jgi:predicted nucleic acid-binding protein
VSSARVEAAVADVVCLDAGVWVKALIAEEYSDHALLLVTSVASTSRVVAPSFCWSEVGSVLRKKVRGGEVTDSESAAAWADFQNMPIEYLEGRAIRDRAWALADRFRRPTLYDAAYLACTEVVETGSRAFWTADDELLAALAGERPPYIHHLRDFAGAG